MPPKMKLSQEQLEVHRACFESPPGSPTAGLTSQGVIEKDLYVFPNGSTLDLTDAIQRAVDKRLSQIVPRPSDGSDVSFVGFNSQGNSDPSLVGLQEKSKVNEQPPQLHSMSEDSNSEQDSEDDEEDEDNLEDLLGVGVNSRGRKVFFDDNVPQKVDIQNTLNDPTSSNQINSVSHLSNPLSGSESTTSPAAVVDPDLPSHKKRKANFVIDPLVVDWARGNFDYIDSGEQIKTLEEEYIPDPSVQDLFSPIRSSNFLIKAMNTEENKDEDTYYFNRSQCEKSLFKSQQLLSLSYAPFMKALTILKDIPGASDARKLIGKGLQAVSTARHEVTFGRRELCRKLVRSDVAPYLFACKPTYKQLFGGESIESQVKLAKEAAKNSQEFIHKRTFKSKSNFSKDNYKKSGFHKGKYQKNQQSGNRSRQGQGRSFQRRKGNGKGKAKSSSSATKAKTDN